MKVFLERLGFFKSGAYSEFSQHSFDSNHLRHLLQKDLKTQERNKDVPCAQKEDVFDKAAHWGKQTFGLQRGSWLVKRFAT